ncbi:type VI secretion system ImpA domain-containing protein [Vibrio qinghaiensis]|uniref:Type VI secretion system ImpA domain-containing protein n=1 Tax=Vibrio qinghaiensis TaxID=2025808 RepID=A0A223N1Q3_9VIBR|nr:type VI secretion system protein TssA [Vibrio qinghaiensis]ASU23669.1 type VI secretion system ImpA domain-containing protein [Vibrio qinghaiensis]
MELTDYRRCITQPIQADNPVGERLIDEPLFDFVEDQMMKVGSLSHASVQWDEVEHSTLKLLSEKSKDLKLLIYLLQCLHNQVTPPRFTTSLQLLSDFMSLYWEDCFPAPGKRGSLPRRKFFSQIVQRLALVIDKLDFAQFDGQDRDELNAAMEALQQATTQVGLMSESVESLVAKVQAQLRRATEREQASQHVQEAPVVERKTTTQSAISVDSSSDKATKQTLLKVAEFLSEQEFGIALAIRVRRFAVWSSITSLPEHDVSGETLLRAMAQERIKEYHDQMRSPDLALWRKVEQSLTMAPYWFEGQLMSYQIAQSLGQKAWSEAILSESQQFVARLPALLELKFKGGEPFVNASVKEWLLSQQQSSAQGQVAGDWQDKRKEAFSLAKEGGIAVALSMLNDGLVSASEPRDKFYWRLLSADLLNSNNLDAMAKEQYQTLHAQVSTMSVTDWEPSLVEQLEQYTTSE